jgi:hypothetical protein
MLCPHLVNNTCDFASQLAEQPVTPHETACAFCTEKCEPSQSVNRVTVSIAIASLPGASPRRSELLHSYGHLLPTAEPRPDNAARLAAILNASGPGSQLWRLLKSIGVKHKTDCGCLSYAEQMNAWGVEGCRARRAEIVAWMEKGAKEYGWSTVLTAAWKTITTGLVFSINPLDRYGSLLDEAIRQAETFAAATPPPRQKLILKCTLCPGDLLTMTAALHALHATYPGEYETDVRTKHPAIWTANPLVTPISDKDKTARVLDMHYPSVHRCNQENAPFLAGYTEYLGEQIGRPLRLRTSRPHVFLTPEEAARPRSKLWPGAPDLSKPYWIVNAGIKRDYTAKAWPMEYFQEVIDRTKDRVNWVQIGLKKDLHRSLRGVINLVDDGGPPMRETIILARHATGGLGPVTFLQHLLAAWEKPYLCVAGGREPSTWIQYPLQQTFHTIGQLDCCRPFSCWRARVVPLKDGNDKDKSLCQYPVTDLERPAPKCLTMIRPSEVVTVLERYL